MLGFLRRKIKKLFLPTVEIKGVEHFNFWFTCGYFCDADTVYELCKNGDGFTIVFMSNEESSFELELTQLNEHPEAYDLGECEFHLAFKVDDYEAAHKLHEEMGCICFENPAMGIYFIEDPDGYWLEIIPEKR